MTSDRCPTCGYHPGTIPSDSNAYHQANCPDKEAHMSEQHKPPSAAEIEELKALEEKATPGPWVALYGPSKRTIRIHASNQRAGMHYAVATVACGSLFGSDRHNAGVADAAFIAAVHNVFPRLLSMLTPPMDAAVREAVEWLEGFRRCTADNNAIGRKDFILEHIETILRAVQAPRLTAGQVKEAYLNGYEDGNEDGRALTGCRNVVEHTPRYDPDTAWAKSDTRAAFPEAFGKEG